MISFACDTDDPISRYGIDHFIHTSGLSVLPAGAPESALCIGYQAEGKGRFSIRIAQNAAVEPNAGMVAMDSREWPLFQVPADTRDAGTRCIAAFRSGDRTYPCISGSSSGIVVGFDIFRLTGSLLSGSLEKADCSDQRPEHESSPPIVSPPLADLYEDVLFRTILMGCGEIGMPLVRKSCWPSGKKYAVCLTHDVDELSKTYQWITRPLRCMRRGDIQGVVNQMKSFSRKIGGYEPYWTFEDIRQKEKNLGVRSTYFFLKESGEKSLFQPESWHLYGRCHSLRTPDIIGLIRKLSEEGHEVGVHGSTYSHTNPALLTSEKAELEELLGTPVEGIRQHRLNLTIPDTWVSQSRAGFFYDTSLGFKAAEGTGFRWGTCFPFHPEGKAGVLPILEIPLSLMDITLPVGEEGWEICKNMIEQVRTVGGVLTVLWHPAVFNSLEYPEIGAWYWKIIERCADDGAWLATGRDIATWWRAREEAVTECRYADDEVSICCNDSDGITFEVYVPDHRSAELVSHNGTLAKTETGYYILSCGQLPDTMVVRLV